MPSPLGHALAGIAVRLAFHRSPAAAGFWRFLIQPLTVISVALAVLPDADLLLRGLHRRATHSVTATILVLIGAIVVTGLRRSRQSALTSRQSPVSVGSRRHQSPATESQPTLHDRRSLLHSVGWGVVWLCVAAHASHLLTDWVGMDVSAPAGIQLLWPFSDRWFISGWPLFPRIERRAALSASSMAINLNAAVWELALMGPIIIALWWLRRGHQRSPQSPQSSQET